MERSTTLIWSWLNVLTKKRYDALLDQFGSLDEALSHIDQRMLAALGCKEETQFTVLNRLDEFNPDAYEAELQKRNVQCISIEDDAYPAVLRTIPDPPVFLYCKGSLDVLNQHAIGIVGTREMTQYGKRVTEEFVPTFVRSGLLTISGLAKGIDATVAEETLHAGGKTVAVLGHGLGQMYPKIHEQLADRIIQEGGAILSEYPLDTAPNNFTFPARNRIVAALSLATLVIEAGEGSGALITADLALEYGKDVFAVPGQIFDPLAVGCNTIIAAGHAKLAVSPEEVLRDLGMIVSEQESITYTSEDPDEMSIYSALTRMPQSVSDLTGQAALEAAVINAKLTVLELQGVVKNVGNGMWVRV